MDLKRRGKSKRRQEERERPKPTIPTARRNLMEGSEPRARIQSPAMKLLLIEDHHDIAANIAEYFEARGDVVAHALDGESGLAMAQQDVYDAIVLDLMLP